MGNLYLVATAGKSSAGNYTLPLLLVVAFGLFYFLLIRPQRNRQRQALETQRQAVPGQRVRTTAGMYATLISADGDDVVLEIAPGVHARFLRRAIMDVLPEDDGADVAQPAADDASTADSAAEDGYSKDLSAGH